VGGQVVAFIDNHMTVFTDAIIDDALVHQTLDNRNIQPARRLTTSTANASDLTVIDVQKRRQAFHPLIEQLPSMNQHKCVDATLGNQPGSHHGFAKCRGRCQHADLVPQHCVRSCLLFRSERSLKGHMQGLAIAPLVTHDSPYVQIRQKLLHIIHAAARQPNVLRIVLGARDDTRLVVCWKAHGLRFVELGILKGRQAEQPVPQSRWQAVPREIDLVPDYELQGVGNVTGNRRFFPATRGCRRPRFRIVFLHLWQPYTDDTSSPFGVPHEVFNCGSAHPRHR
jgi:hypothetical protein